MNCPHCSKVIVVKLTKDSNVGQSEPVPTGDLGGLLDSIDVGRLSGQALDFVTQTRERYRKYKDTTRLTEKQFVWLEKIAAGECYEEF